MDRRNSKKSFGRPLDAAKSEAILRAAARVFANVGFDGCSIEAIARDAGVSKVTVYSRFRNKENLFRATVELKCEQLSRVLIETDGSMPVAHQLKDFAIQMQSLVFNPGFARLERQIAAEAERDPKAGEALLDAGPRRIRASLAQMLEVARANDELAFEDSLLAAEQFASMVKGFADLEFRVGSKLDHAQNRKRIDAAVDLFMRVYGKQTS